MSAPTFEMSFERWDSTSFAIYRRQLTEKFPQVGFWLNHHFYISASMSTVTTCRYFRQSLHQGSTKWSAQGFLTLVQWLNLTPLISMEWRSLFSIVSRAGLKLCTLRTKTSSILSKIFWYLTSWIVLYYYRRNSLVVKSWRKTRNKICLSGLIRATWRRQ